MRKISSRMILIMISIPLLLNACQRSASVNPGAVNNPTTAVEVEPTANPAQQSISETQTQVSNPTATLFITLPVVAIRTPEAAVTQVEIVATITPTLQATSVPEEVVVPTVKKPVSYIMQAMENTYCIARRFNVDIGELLSINKLTTESVVEAGTTINLPYTGHPWSSGPRALLPHPVKYTVKNGDTIFSIACQYGDVSPEAIIAVNKLSEPVTLQVGQVIDIP
jgi:LysM repeat protein